MRKINGQKKAVMGFTLVELMLVVIIIGTLVAMVMPRLSGRSEQAKVSAAKADVSANIATALKLYELDNGNFPSSADGGSPRFSRSRPAPRIGTGLTLRKNRWTPGAESISTATPGRIAPLTTICIRSGPMARRARTTSRTGSRHHESYFSGDFRPRDFSSR